MQTKISKIIYAQEANCTIWEQTLKRLVPNESILKYLQKAVGYTISGKYKEKALFILIGGGNNEKTTFINIIREIMDGYSVVVAPATIMENFSNKNSGSRPDLVKLRCRGLHKEPVEFPEVFKLWFDCAR